MISKLPKTFLASMLLALSMLAAAETPLPDKQVMWLSSDNPELIPNQLYIFEQNGKKGLKDRTGKIIFPAEYEGFEYMAADFGISEERIIAIQSTGMALADTQGNLLTEPKYGFILNSLSKDGTTHFSDENILHGDAKLGAMNRDGKEIIPAIYDNLGQFQDGYAWAVKEEREHFIDLSGSLKWTLPIDWHTSHDYYAQDKVIVQNKEGAYALYSVTGQAIIPFGRYQNLRINNRFLNTEQNSGFGLADLTTGQEILPARFSQPILETDEQVLSAQADGKVYLFDLKGKQLNVRPAQFAQLCQAVYLGAAHKKQPAYRVTQFDADNNRVTFIKGKRPRINEAAEADAWLEGECTDVVHQKK